jgi:(p)ppGpp synthase/HD superfamily hydrolase
MGRLKNYLTEEELNKLISIDDEYEKADYLINILFKDILDKNGENYTGHLYRVSEGVNEIKTKVAALLHDTVEDIDGVTFEDLLDVGFSNEVVDMVRIVTLDKPSKDLPEEERVLFYERQITKIIESKNQEAIKLKFSDISDNFNEERLNKLDEERRNYLIRKY